jgi:hypothetical protein
VIYIGHGAIDKYFGDKEANKMMDEAEKESL